MNNILYAVIPTIPLFIFAGFYSFMLIRRNKAKPFLFKTDIMKFNDLATNNYWTVSNQKLRTDYGVEKKIVTQFIAVVLFDPETKRFSIETPQGKMSYLDNSLGCRLQAAALSVGGNPLKKWYGEKDNVIFLKGNKDKI